MANWTLLEARNKVKWYLQPVNVQFYLDVNNAEATITDLINAGLADLCSTKAPYMLWDNHDVPCSSTKILMLDEDMLSVKRVETMTSATDTSPVELRRPEDYTIHETYLEFTQPYTGIVRVLATRKPTVLTLDTETLPVGNPFQLGVVYYAVAQCCLRGGNAGVALANQFMGYYDRIKALWERQTMNESITLRGQDDNPANDGTDFFIDAGNPRGVVDV